jgi:tRNA-specific adenosine deaminase 1
MSNLKQEIVDSWSSEFRYKPFSIVTTAAKFDFSRKVEEVGGRLISSNKSVIWCPYVQEVLVGGVLQGRKVSDPRGASEISRRKMWQAVMKVLEALEDSNDSTNDIRVYKDYRSLKSNERLKPRRMVKTNVTTVLQGWVQNDGDDSFCLD